MIRVLQMGMTDNLGGIETFLMNYYRNLNKNEIQFDFTNIYPNDLCFQKELEDSGSKIYNIPNYYKHPIKYLKEVSKIIKDNHYEIVHCNMNSAVFLYPLIAAKLGGAKVIISHSHNSSSDKGIIKTILHHINKHFIPLFANTYFACSNKAGEWFYSKKIMQGKNYFVIKNAIDTKKFAFNEKLRKQKRKELNIDEDTIVLGHVGRFSKQKNHKFLIDIFYEFQKENSNSKLILIGVGPLQEKIKEKVNNLNLSDKVLFLNQRNDVNKLLNAMDYFILPSLYEGLPLVLIEAQSNGLTCIVSDNITKEANINERIYFCDLNAQLQTWVKRIKTSYNIETRTSKENDCRNKEYDIKSESNKLTNKYIKLLKYRR